MTDFYAKLGEVLEVDEVQPSDDIRSLPEWDSLAALSVIAMVNTEYRVTLTAADLKSAGSAQALHDLVASKCR
ncbi:MAG: acyl carrier protein [Chloroflexi bacterium]|nr:acyl carrier protein [Chloroflexota bacterium]